MTSMNQALLTIGDVKAFRGHAVVGGLVAVMNDEFVNHLNESYGEAVICNLNVKPGEALRLVAPLRFEQMRAEHQEELQNELTAQVVAQNDVDIDYHN